MKKVSIICTTFNEEKTIESLLESLAAQTYKPAEIIICDNNSSDKTQEIIENFIDSHRNTNILKITKVGNRSVGRNTAIKAATSEIIAITDAGCIPEKKWLEELLKTYEEKNAPVVAGYYKGLATTPFEEAVIPYVLVMPDKVDPNNFLPATRSVLLEKKIWEAVGGFDEQLALNEDYPFARKIKEKGFSIAFAKNAVVQWMPRKNIFEFNTMISRFAKGDIQAGILRPKVAFLFFRYMSLLVVLGIMTTVNDFREIMALLLTLFVLYSGWAIQKNSKYVKKGWYWLPVLQYVADYSVIKGSLTGILRKLN